MERRFSGGSPFRPAIESGESGFSPRATRRREREALNDLKGSDPFNEPRLQVRGCDIAPSPRKPVEGIFRTIRPYEGHPHAGEILRHGPANTRVLIDGGYINRVLDPAEKMA